MLLSQGVLKHVGQRSPPGLNPNWQQQAGKQKPHTSTIDHGCATRPSAEPAMSTESVWGCSGHCGTCYPAWDISLVGFFSRSEKKKISKQILSSQWTLEQEANSTPLFMSASSCSSVTGYTPVWSPGLSSPDTGQVVA